MSRIDNAPPGSIMQVTRLFLSERLIHRPRPSQQRVHFRTPDVGVFFVEGISVNKDNGEPLNGSVSLVIGERVVSSIEITRRGTVFFPDRCNIKITETLKLIGHKVSPLQYFGVNVDAVLDGMYVNLSGVLIHPVPETPDGATEIE